MFLTTVNLKNLSSVQSSLLILPTYLPVVDVIKPYFWFKSGKSRFNIKLKQQEQALLKAKTVLENSYAYKSIVFTIQCRLTHGTNIFQSLNFGEIQISSKKVLQHQRLVDTFLQNQNYLKIVDYSVSAVFTTRRSICKRLSSENEIFTIYFKHGRRLQIKLDR